MSSTSNSFKGIYTKLAVDDPYDVHDINCEARPQSVPELEMFIDRYNVYSFIL